MALQTIEFLTGNMKNKSPAKFLSVVLSVSVACAFTIQPQTAYAQISLPITASSAVLLDHGSVQMMYAKSAHVKRAPASTTKVLTALVVMDHMALDEVVTIPKFAESIEPSKIYLKAGERYYVRDLLRAILTKSANDAAETLAHVTGGSRTAFSEMMNQKARAIGCRNSRFVRASGLPAKNQYSTAYDLALIMKHAEQYPFVMETLGTKTLTISSLGGRKISLRNHNKMLWRDSREVIGKTGWTRKARHCFAGTIHSLEKMVSISIMGSSSPWRDLKILVDYRFGKSLVVIKQNRKLWSRDETERIQTALKKAGFSPGSIDGRFGPATVRAVKSFQRDRGLKADGIVGDKTWDKLKAYA